MIDFHSHILPGMDDGSQTVEESLTLLEMLRAQGVDTVAATPHFYARENSPEVFLRRRREAWERLNARLTPGGPQVLLGAEVRYYRGISRLEELHRLCLSGTHVLLLEMPFPPGPPASWRNWRTCCGRISPWCWRILSAICRISLMSCGPGCGIWERCFSATPRFSWIGARGAGP